MTEQERWMMAGRRDMRREIVAYLEVKRDVAQLHALGAADKSREEVEAERDAQKLNELMCEVDRLP